MSPRHIKVLTMMAIVFIALLVVDRLFLQEPPQTVSQQLAGTEVMDFLQEAYVDPAMLRADLAELDEIAARAKADAKTYLEEAILRKSLDRFEDAVMLTPDAPLAALHKYLIANMATGTFFPACAASIAPQIRDITANMQPPAPQTPPGRKPKFYIYRLMADIMRAADDAALAPPPPEKTADKLAKFYSLSQIMVMKQQGMTGLMERIASGNVTEEDRCQLLVVEAMSLDFVPEHAYSDMLKGAVISGIRLRLTNGPIAP